jgi:hypothetical protein
MYCHSKQAELPATLGYLKVKTMAQDIKLDRETARKVLQDRLNRAIAEIAAWGKPDPTGYGGKDENDAIKTLAATIICVQFLGTP